MLLLLASGLRLILLLLIAFARDSARSSEFPIVILHRLVVLLLPVPVPGVAGALLQALVVGERLLHLTLIDLLDCALVGTPNDALPVLAIAALEYASTISHIYI